MTHISDIAVIGLGAIGMGIATSLLREGYCVYGVDRNAPKLEALNEINGIACASPAEAAEKVGAIIVAVVNDDQTEEVLFGEKGAVAKAAPGTLFILSNTIAPSTTTRIGGELDKLGMLVLDAPVIGGPNLALNGDLIIMASGDPETLDLAEPIFDSISARVEHLGSVLGQATQIKLINQLLTDIHIAAAAEALSLADSIGINLSTLFSVISNYSGNSAAFQSRGEKLIKDDFKPRSTISNIVKDLKIVHNESRMAGLDLPLTQSALALYSEAVEKGLEHEDGIAVAKLLKPEVKDE